MFEPKGRYHMFDGDGMLSALSLDGHGQVSFRNRLVQTDGLAVERRLGRSVYGGIADGGFPSSEDTAGDPPIKNVINTNVIRHAGRILCLWEGSLPT